MAAIEDIEIPSLLLAEQPAAPATPATGTGRLFIKADGVYFVGDDGIEVGPFAAGSSPTFTGAKATLSADGGTSSEATAANNTIAVIGWDAEEIDTDAFHAVDTATNRKRMVIPAGLGGYYLAGFSVESNASLAGAGRVAGWLQKNGAVIKGSATQVANGPVAGDRYCSVAASAPFAAAVGDYIEVGLYQGTGGTFTAEATNSGFWIYKIG